MHHLPDRFQTTPCAFECNCLCCLLIVFILYHGHTQVDCSVKLMCCHSCNLLQCCVVATATCLPHWLHLIVFGNWLLCGTWAMPPTCTRPSKELNFETKRVSFSLQRNSLNFLLCHFLSLDALCFMTFTQYFDLLLPLFLLN